MLPYPRRATTTTSRAHDHEMGDTKMLRHLKLTGLCLGTTLLFACGSGDVSGGGGAPTGAGGDVGTGAGGSSTGGSAGTTSTGTGGVTGTGTGGSSGAGGAATGAGGSVGTGGSPGTGGRATGTGGSAGTGGSTGTGGVMTGAGGAGGGGTVPPPAALDCGPIGTVMYNAGPPANRVNYVVLADGYTSTTVGTTLMTDMNRAMTERFTSEIGQPYLRYKNFVNVCLFKTVSQSDGIGNGSTIFNCTGSDSTRLATCDTNIAMQQLTANTPKGMTVDWHSIVLNNSAWWNTGSVWMLWSGGNSDGPKAALHEGGHGFHQLADEYCASATGARCGNGVNNMTGAVGQEFGEINSTGNPMTTGGKWLPWLALTQKGLSTPDMGATGLQGTFVASRYVDTGQYRPSANSKMNSLFGNALDTSYNSVSREKMVLDIWRFVTPVDSTVPAAGAVAGATKLTVNVVDPAVINVDWSIDGTVVAANGGISLDLATRSLPSGMHTVTAKAYDNATQDLVRQTTGTTFSRMNWVRSQQTVTWNVTIP
jgi:hypothetical protein